MKKLLFFIVLFGVAFGLKAQQKSAIVPLEKFTFPNPYPQADLNLRAIPEKRNDVNALFAPKQNTVQNNMIAALDRMPIIKPVGKWNMPIVHPDGTTVYTTPIVGLPPVVKPETQNQKINP